MVTILRAGALTRATGVPGRGSGTLLSRWPSDPTTSPRAPRTRAQARAAAGGRLTAILDPQGPRCGGAAGPSQIRWPTGGCHEHERPTAHHRVRPHSRNSRRGAAGRALELPGPEGAPTD